MPVYLPPVELKGDRPQPSLPVYFRTAMERHGPLEFVSDHYLLVREYQPVRTPDGEISEEQVIQRLQRRELFHPRLRGDYWFVPNFDQAVSVYFAAYLESFTYLQRNLPEYLDTDLPELRQGSWQGKGSEQLWTAESDAFLAADSAHVLEAGLSSCSLESPMGTLISNGELSDTWRIIFSHVTGTAEVEQMDNPAAGLNLYHDSVRRFTVMNCLRLAIARVNQYFGLDLSWNDLDASQAAIEDQLLQLWHETGGGCYLPNLRAARLTLRRPFLNIAYASTVVSTLRPRFGAENEAIINPEIPNETTLYQLSLAPASSDVNSYDLWTFVVLETMQLLCPHCSFSLIDQVLQQNNQT